MPSDIYNICIYQIIIFSLKKFLYAKEESGFSLYGNIFALMAFYSQRQSQIAGHHWKEGWKQSTEHWQPRLRVWVHLHIQLHACVSGRHEKKAGPDKKDPILKNVQSL